MAAQFSSGPWLTIGKLVELFTAMGCEERPLPGMLVNADGTKRTVHYLFNPENNGFVSLRDYARDERIPPPEVENWERRLGMIIPKGPMN